ncbi:MAG TPA: biopolymer transporter ExbD [Isosphaeraceae bacterium]|jgi:hypothetical protein|nr:biopolymer transporter ExbD [Isosphaeraceae bacterium]
MFRRTGLLLGILLAWASIPVARADEFDSLEGQALASVPDRKGATPHARLTLAELGNLPPVLRGTRSGLVVVRTEQGNLARLLMVPAFRKPPGGQGEPIPVISVERFATYEAGKATTRPARGVDLLLFDGFQLDLDSGQVVPDGQGGDLQFLATGEGGPRVVALKGTTMYTLTDSPVPLATTLPGPSAGRAVLPGDFAGRYRLFANGNTSGTLELSVDAKGAVTGQFRSDLNGAFYPVSGQVATDVPQKVTFRVTYPRSTNDFEGYLWTDGKGAMAGTVVMVEHPHGFFAIREGGRYAPEAANASNPPMP